MCETEVLLIGAGPIGLEMAVALKDAGVDYLHVDARQIGHTISWFPRQCRFFSSPERIAICGVPLETVDQSKASREEYLAYLRGIVRQFDLQVRTFEKVTAIRRISESSDGGRFAVETAVADGNRKYNARHVILAIGDMHHPRILRSADGSPVPGTDLPHVSHYFDEAHTYFGRKLLIVGGKNSAVEAAIRCHRAGANVAISYRRDQFNETSIKYWLKPEIDGLIKTGAIQFYPHTIPSLITATTVVLESTAANGGQTQEIPADFVLMLIGYEMDSSLLSMAGVDLIGESRAPALNVDTMETNVAGLFVAGTAAAGTQLRFKLFIENCHSHVLRIMRALTGDDPRHLNPLGYQHVDTHPLAAES